MSRDPWTDPDPQPGDLDAELELLDDGAFEHHERDPSATLKLMVVVEGEDASRLARIAEAGSVGDLPTGLMTARR